MIELNQPATVSGLLEAIGLQYPALAVPSKSALVAVNHEYADLDQPLSPGDEIALFPPVSGG